MLFQDLQLLEPIQKALKTTGYHKPTPIQAQSIPFALEGKDLMACAQTGTGKTAAFAIPTIQLLQNTINKNRNYRPIRSLILAPTRELAIQIGESFQVYGKYTDIRHTVIFGGVSQHDQTNKLKRGVDVLIATPGRLLDLMGQGFIKLDKIEIFTLDEADRMLDMGFLHDIRRILQVLPDNRQTFFFSATMPNDIIKLSRSILQDPVKIMVDPVSSTAERVEQSVYHVSKKNKKRLLQHLLDELDIPEALVFTRTKYGANKVVKELNKIGISAEAIHGNKSQGARQNALKSFKNRKTRVLVATDIASRGIDIDQLSTVINYDLPNISETYIHRIGRTGRAGATGISISFCDLDEKAHLRDIEKLAGERVEVIENHPYPITREDRVIYEEKKLEKPKKKTNNRYKGRRYHHASR